MGKEKVGAEVGQSYPSGSRRFAIHFQQDRKKELVLKSRTLVIMPYATAEITEEELQSPEFQTQVQYFGITEVV